MITQELLNKVAEKFGEMTRIVLYSDFSGYIEVDDNDGNGYQQDAYFYSTEELEALSSNSNPE